jgi:hypothetical protein
VLSGLGGVASSRAVGVLEAPVEPDDDLDLVAVATVHVVAVPDPGRLQSDVEVDLLQRGIDPTPVWSQYHVPERYIRIIHQRGKRFGRHRWT